MTDTPSFKDLARQARLDAERVAIREALERVHWNRVKAAQLLQISYKALLYKIVQCGLVDGGPRSMSDTPPPAATMAEPATSGAAGMNAVLDAAEAQFLALSPEKRREALTVCEEVLDGAGLVQPERALIVANMLRALRATNGHRVRAAWLVGIAPKTLYNRIKQWPELREAPPSPRVPA